MFTSKSYLGLKLSEATLDNKLLEKLEEQWKGQLLAYGEVEYAETYLEHARDVIRRQAERAHAGVYVLTRGEDDALFYEGLAHFNVAELPKTTGKTLRAVWILLAPRFDFSDIEEEELAAISAGFIYGGIDVAHRPETEADHYKLFLKNIGDRKMAHGMAYSLRARNPSVDVAFKGNWLHIDNVSTLKDQL